MKHFEKLLIIHHSFKEEIERCCTKSVHPIYFDETTTLKDLSDQILSRKGSFDRIGFFMHGSSKIPSLLKNSDEFSSFLQKFHFQHLDMISCHLGKYQKWNQLFRKIQNDVHIQIHTSNGYVGNASQGGSWISSSGIDFSKTYFNKKINEFKGVLSGTTSLNSLTATNVYNTTARINYNLRNFGSKISGFDDVYLYRFTSPNIPPSTNPTINGTAVQTISVPYDGSVNSSFNQTSISPSTTYYYAVYTTNDSSGTIFTIGVGPSNYITVQTKGVSQSSMTATAITPTSVTINYSIDNAADSATATLYLYSYVGTTSSVSLLNISTGTQRTSVSPAIPITLAAGSSTTDSVTITGLTSNTIYSFQFYIGNDNGTSPILRSTTSSGTIQFVSFKTFVSNTALTGSASSITANISYTLSNTLNSSRISFLYRFTSGSAPTTLNTSTGTFVTGGNITTNSGTNTSPTVNTSTLSVSGLSINTTYTFAFYNGQTNGSSTILTDTNGTSRSVTLTTTNYQNPITYNYTFNTFKNTSVYINMISIDPQNSALTYTYTSPSNGVLSGTPPNLLYTPNFDYMGNDSFTFYTTKYWTWIRVDQETN
jgi:hypothetical protein